MKDRPSETGLIGGVEKREIKIVRYDSGWPKKFRTQAKIIADALGTAALRIEHIIDLAAWPSRQAYHRHSRRGPRFRG